MLDAHIHVVPPRLPGTGPLAPLLTQPITEIARELQREMREADVTMAFAMGAWDCTNEDPLGINSTLKVAELVPELRAIGIADPTRTDDEHFRRVEVLLKKGAVVALKGYLGYLHYEPAHPNYQRYYELAARYKIPVMFHTGDTYSPRAKLKYAHPLGVDEVAVDHPECRFVMCHLCNPWTLDAAEVIYKNLNVWADLSGLMVGTDEVFASEEGQEAAEELSHAILRAIRYSERPNRFIYGTDWPLAPMAAYRDFIRNSLPEELQELIFEENANRLFGLS